MPQTSEVPTIVVALVSGIERKIWGFHRGDCEECRLLRCGTYRSFVNRCFVGTYRLHFQGRKTAADWVCSHLFTLVSRSRFLYSEDGGDTFLRNVGSHKIYTAPHSRRRHLQWHQMSSPAQNIEIVCSNFARGIYVCVYSVLGVLCAGSDGSDLATGWSPVQVVLTECLRRND
jgi:hypothetical protein